MHCAAQEIRVDAAVVAALSEVNGIFALIEEQICFFFVLCWKVALRLTGFGKSSVKHSGAWHLSAGR